MSKYTTQVRWIVEVATPDFSGSINERIRAACPKIFNFDFPIWSEEYRVELETKILRHYYMSEIGMETVALWKLFLETELNEIMPYYNQLYLTTVKDYDYMVDVDVTETTEENEGRQEDANFHSTEENDTDTTDDTTSHQTTDANSTENVSGTPATHTSHNDFPQAPIETKDYATYEDYTQQTLSQNTVSDNLEDLDSTVKNIRTTNHDVDYSSTNRLTANRDTDRNLHRRGLNGSRSFTDLLLQYRDSIINIDKMIIDELKDLFMSVY